MNLSLTHALFLLTELFELETLYATNTAEKEATTPLNSTAATSAAMRTARKKS